MGATDIQLSMYIVSVRAGYAVHRLVLRPSMKRELGSVPCIRLKRLSAI